ncbi:MAG: T9SS type A sorting domain-containing protein [Bacteroidetes bacterium]|nr:T9SS type A sorting domain-containing protein [Bacteroidota bacterium]
MKVIHLIIFAFFSNLVIGQIPNNGFEAWISMPGYSTPGNWDNLNQATYYKNVFTCNQGTPGNPGASYLFLISKNVPGKGIVPGRVVSGKIDTISFKAISGYPFSNRPQQLNYNIQYMPYDPSDSVSVSVLLTKWDTTMLMRDTVAYGASYYNAMAHSWFVGSTYMNYLSGEAPDSAMIVISSSSSNPKDGSYIYIDNLQFSGSVIGISENSFLENNIQIYPNPSSDNIYLRIGESIKSVDIQLFDVLGNKLLSDNITNQSTISILNYPSGIYFLRITENNRSINKKIIKQ